LRGEAEGDLFEAGAVVEEEAGDIDVEVLLTYAWRREMHLGGVNRGRCGQDDDGRNKPHHSSGRGRELLN